MIQNFWNKTVKPFFLAVHLFSATPLYVIFVITALISLFYEGRGNYLQFFSIFLVSLLILGSIFSFFLLNNQQYLPSIKKMVGSALIDQFFPPSSFYSIRGLKPVIIFAFTVILLLVIDYISLEYYYFLQFEKIAEMEKNSADLWEKDHSWSAFDPSLDVTKECQNSRSLKGIIGRLVNDPRITYYIDFFSWKKC